MSDGLRRRPDSFLRAQGALDDDGGGDEGASRGVFSDEEEATELDTLTTNTAREDEDDAERARPAGESRPAPAPAPAPEPRVPVAAAAAAPVPVRGHNRSASHGGAALSSDRERGEREKTTSAFGKQQPKQQLPPSVLKKSSTLQGHRRVFSHGQITFRDGVIEMGGGGGGSSGGSGAAGGAADMSVSGDRPATASSAAGGHVMGHRRTGSKTEFILPPGHEERERRRASAAATSLQRTGSHRGGSAGGRGGDTLPGSAGGHRRHPSRSDSLAFSFRGHSRQASRTDSIYTLRNHTTNYKRKVFCFGRKNKAEPEAKHRTVVPNHCIPADVPEAEHPNAAYLDNYVRTTKYTVLSFLPKNLFEQFHRFANLYFLFIVLLNWVPAINAFGKEISMLPVIFVLGVTAIKDIFEDRRRALSDKRVNNSTCRVYNG